MAKEKEPLMVIKRNGKKVEYNGNKIAIAIKKGFDSITVLNEFGEETKVYSEKDINKVFIEVENDILKNYKEKIKIEEIQDLIEKYLQKLGYEDVYKSFSEYRERRNHSREVFFDDKKVHKFLKTIEVC